MAGTGSCPLYGRQCVLCVDGKGREFVYMHVWEGPVKGGGQSGPICLTEPPTAAPVQDRPEGRHGDPPHA